MTHFNPGADATGGCFFFCVIFLEVQAVGETSSMQKEGCEMFVAKDSKGRLVTLVSHQMAETLHDTYVCPACERPVGIRNGAIMPAHFYHRGPACQASEPESAQHLSGKLWLQELGAALGYAVTLEAYYPEIQQRADVVWHRPDGPLVLEFQCSPISVGELARRTRGYHQLGLVVIWVMGRRYFSAQPSAKQAKFLMASAALGWHLWALNVARGRLERWTWRGSQIQLTARTLRQRSVRAFGWERPLGQQATAIQQALFFRDSRAVALQNAALMQGKNIGGTPWVVHEAQTGLIGLAMPEWLLRTAWLLTFEGEVQITSEAERRFWLQYRSEKTPLVGNQPLAAVRRQWLTHLVDASYLVAEETGWRWVAHPKWYPVIDAKLAEAPTAPSSAG